MNNKYSAQEKTRAVLSIWAEKRKARDICREMEVSAGLLHHWQETAMEGMLLALEPKWRDDNRCPAILPKLKKLLEKKATQREGRLPRLEKRLVKLQDPAESGKS
jgi:transposase-like protein